MEFVRAVISLSRISFFINHTNVTSIMNIPLNVSSEFSTIHIIAQLCDKNGKNVKIVNGSVTQMTYSLRHRDNVSE